MLPRGAADLLSSGPPGCRSVLAVLGPPGPLPVPGGSIGSWAVSPAPCAPGSSRVCCSPLGSSAAGCGRSPQGAAPVGAPGSQSASPPSWSPAPPPCERLSAREGWGSSCSSGPGSPVLGALAAALARLLTTPPLGGLFSLVYS